MDDCFCLFLCACVWCNPHMIPTSPHVCMFSNLAIHSKQKCPLSGCNVCFLLNYEQEHAACLLSEDTLKILDQYLRSLNSHAYHSDTRRNWKMWQIKKSVFHVDKTDRPNDTWPFVNQAAYIGKIRGEELLRVWQESCQAYSHVKHVRRRWLGRLS